MAPANLSSWSRVPDTLTHQYRGVTRFGSSGFAACGTAGLITVSKDSGASWSSVNIGSANLLGITAGGDKILAVGAAGTILVSSNNAVTWTSANSTTTSALNDVVYTGQGYVAVGDGGLILTSDDGVSWNQHHISPTTNLRGVAFDQVRGVGVIVGDNGRVLIAGPLPTAVLDSRLTSATVRQHSCRQL